MVVKQVLWISHRGYHARVVENTCASFYAAIAAGFTHLETDLRATLDGQIILHHDQDLQKSCGAKNIIQKSQWSELEAILTRDGQKLLKFDEFIDRYAGFSWTFDINPETAGSVLRSLLKWANQNKAMAWLHEQARFLCWSRSVERYLQQVLPNVKTLARQDECYRAGLAVFAQVPWVGGIRPGRIYALPRFFAGRDLFTSSVVAAYHSRGARVLAYLPEQETDTIAAVSAGFDEILTNNLPIICN